MIKCVVFFFIFMQSLAFAVYHSQCRQDKFVNEALFHNAKNGFFLDVGAHDGVTFSNTCFFEKELGWKGICFEPNPPVFEKLQKNRTCKCICGCVATEHNVVASYLQITGPLEMLSGLTTKFELQHRERIERQLKEYGGSYKVIEVPCYNLNRVLEEAGITHVNYFSIDTEGGEFEILQNFDFSKCQVDVIVLEDNYKNYPFVSLLEVKGFKLLNTLEQDLVFVHNNFKAN